MVYEYQGFYVCWLGVSSYQVVGPGLRGYTASVVEAVKLVDGFIAGQCE